MNKSVGSLGRQRKEHGLCDAIEAHTDSSTGHNNQALEASISDSVRNGLKIVFDCLWVCFLNDYLPIAHTDEHFVADIHAGNCEFVLV